MFTGLIREIGKVLGSRKRSGGTGIAIACPVLAAEVRAGDSVCVDGACLTAENVSGGGFTAYASSETLKRTTLASLKRGGRVNLEPALRASDRLGGHIVQGHVEGVGEVVLVQPEGEGAAVAVRIPRGLVAAVVPKGSIAIAGVSLTVAECREDIVTAAVVPVTLMETTIGSWTPGTRVNIETDLLGRHIVRYMESLGLRPGITVEDLVKKGF